MAKNFGNINTDKLDKQSGECMLYEKPEQATGKGGQQGTATPEEIRRRQDSLKTQGRKGAKAIRINMAFTPNNHEFIRVMSKASGKSMTEFTNLIITAYRNEHPELMEQANQFLNMIEGGKFLSLDKNEWKTESCSAKMPENKEEREQKAQQLLDPTIQPLNQHPGFQNINNEAMAEKKEEVITTIGGRLLLLSAPKFQNAFNTQLGNKSGIFALDKQGKQELAFNINIPFLQGLFKAAYEHYLKAGDLNSPVYVDCPKFIKELGIDPTRKHPLTETAGEKQLSCSAAREQYMGKFIIQVNQIYGKIKDQSGYYKIFDTLRYDNKAELITFTSPYFAKILELNLQKEPQANNSKCCEKWKCDLMYSSVASERNKPAIEMAQRILVGVQRRGTARPDSCLEQYRGSRLPDKDIFTWYITCKGLINDCPQIKNLLDRQKSTSNKTHVLQHAFKAMYKILRTKSDLYDYYLNLSITEIIPTYSTLNKTAIRITYYGRNPDYA